MRHTALVRLALCSRRPVYGPACPAAPPDVDACKARSHTFCVALVVMSSSCSERGCAHMCLALSSSAAGLPLADMLLPPWSKVQADQLQSCLLSATHPSKHGGQLHAEADEEGSHVQSPSSSWLMTFACFWCTMQLAATQLAQTMLQQAGASEAVRVSTAAAWH